jgi:transposase
MNKCLSVKGLLPDSAVLNVLSVEKREDRWAIRAEMHTLSATCPQCGLLSHARHSHYWRKLRDLPAMGEAVRLELRVGR